MRPTIAGPAGCRSDAERYEPPVRWAARPDGRGRSPLTADAAKRLYAAVVREHKLRQPTLDRLINRRRRVALCIQERVNPRRRSVGEVTRPATSCSAALAGHVRSASGSAIHAGPAIVGRMGYGEGVYLTGGGDTVHSRAASSSSRRSMAARSSSPSRSRPRGHRRHRRFPRHELTVRNRGGLLAVRVIDDLERLESG